MKKLVYFTLAILIFSCKNSASTDEIPGATKPPSAAEIEREQLLAKENEILKQKLELEQLKIEEEIEEKNQREKALDEQKKAEQLISSEVLPYVNKVFLKWGSSWMIDNYLNESLKIDRFTKNGDILNIEGTFKFNRAGNIKIGKFEGSLDILPTEMKIRELCYFFESESDCI